MEIVNLKQLVSRIVGDRPFFWLCIGLIVTGVLCALTVGLNIHASDVTIYSRYTAFGEAHFYKSHWQYLLLFALFSISTTITHITLMMKLYNIERRQTALLVGWVGLVILIVGAAYALSVIQLGQVA